MSERKVLDQKTSDSPQLTGEYQIRLIYTRHMDNDFDILQEEYPDDDIRTAAIKQFVAELTEVADQGFLPEGWEVTGACFDDVEERHHPEYIGA
tara:strand:+ start:24941 stop:25222 length:282 start_codon:yes stop_codon:yes gene_type:complete